MTMKLDDLKRLLDGQKLKYFLAPDRPTAMLGMLGPSGPYQFVVKIEVDGRFLQFRTVALAYCGKDHEHLDAVMRLLGELNARLRLFKFAWDPNDGEIIGFADIWIEDGTVTEGQFTRMLHNFVPVIDLNLARIRTTIETGSDPGEVGAPGTSAPPGWDEILKKIAEAKKAEEDKKQKAEPSGPATI